jgi:hypothetical protein
MTGRAGAGGARVSGWIGVVGADDRDVAEAIMLRGGGLKTNAIARVRDSLSLAPACQGSRGPTPT